MWWGTSHEEQQEQAQRADLVAKLVAAMLDSDALWATDAEALAELAVDVVGDWCLDDRFSAREKWLRFDARRRHAGNQP